MSKKLLLLLPITLLISIFLLFKLDSLAIRLSDTNIYFYTAKELLAGNVLYKDIFFTNFPLVPYVASFYFLISKGSLLFYFFTASMEVGLTAMLLFWIVYRQWQSRLLALLTAVLYLFSFMVLATTQHQTGVFLASLCITASYFFLKRKQYTLTGVFTALAFLTKAYTLPLLLTYCLYLFIKQKKMLLPFLLGTIGTGVIVLLPSLLLAPKEFLTDVFAYSLTRSQGISKKEILWFILRHDFLFVVLLFFNMLTLRKNLLFGLFSLFGLLFFILYQDTYYLYLNILLPFLCLSFPLLIQFVTIHFSINRFMIPTVIGVFIVINIFSYFSGGFTSLQKLSSLPEMVQLIQQEKPKVLYGVNGVVQALSYTSGVPLLHNLLDTNDNIFRKGYLNAKTLTADAIDQQALIVTTGAWYPQTGVEQDVLTEIVDQDQLRKNCNLKKRFFFQSEGIVNAITFFRC